MRKLNTSGANNPDIHFYQKKLYFAFKPRILEIEYYQPVDVSYKSFLRSDGTLDLFAFLKSYQAYVNRRGRKAFAHARKRKDGRYFESAYHYSLDTFLSAVKPPLSRLFLARFAP